MGLWKVGHWILRKPAMWGTWFLLLVGAWLSWSPFLLSAISLWMAATFLFQHMLARSQKKISDLNSEVLFASLPDPVLLISDSGDIIASTPAADCLFDASDERLQGHNIESLIAEPFVKNHRMYLQHFFTSKGDIRKQHPVRARTFSGKHFDANVYLNYVHINDSHYALVVIHDSTESHRQQHLLKLSRKQFVDTFSEAAVGLAHLSLDGRFLLVNYWLLRFLGYERKQLLGMDFFEITHPEDVVESREKFQQMLSGNAYRYTHEKRVLLKGGGYVWISLAVAVIYQDEGRPDYFVVVIEDISKQKESECLLRQSEQKFRTIVDSLSDTVAIWMLSPDKHQILYVNYGYEKIWGQTRDELYECADVFEEKIHPVDYDRVKRHKQLQGNGRWEIDYRILRNKDDCRYVHESGFSVYGEDGKLLYIVSTVIDKTDEVLRQAQLDDSLQKLKEAYRELSASSKVDGLTGVLNRKAIYLEISKEFNRYRRYKTPVCLVFIDVDDFKYINDEHGHLTGDQMLVALTRQIKANIRATDVLGRYGGDEFILLLRDTTLEQATDFSQRFLGNGIQLCIQDELEYELSLSIGIHSLTDSVASLDEWLNIADQRMYQDKRSRKGNAV